MHQFDVFANPVARAGHALPFIILLQSDRAQTGGDRVVAPLALPSAVAGMATDWR
jgi:hypothetical protein